MLTVLGAKANDFNKKAALQFIVQSRAFYLASFSIKKPKAYIYIGLHPEQYGLNTPNLL